MDLHGIVAEYLERNTATLSADFDNDAERLTRMLAAATGFARKHGDQKTVSRLLPRAGA